MIRILQCVNNMHRAGLETILMNYYRNIDRTKIQFDFLTHRPERSDYDDEIKSLGGRIYHAPRLYPQNYPAYFSYMNNFFKEHPEYKIMHSHIDAMSYLPLLAGKKAGIPIRIAHSHSTSIDLDFKYGLKQLFRYRIPHAANYYCACGEEAGKFLFRGKNFRIITNAIDAECFRFNPDVRTMTRKELEIEDAFVVGHVGRFSFSKNHDFVADIFAEILKRERSAVLLLVGTGEKEQEVREKIKALGIDEHVRFLGNRSDVNELYQAMDVLILPSLFEGVPVVGIEAQFAGLPCIFSDKVPTEVMFTELSQFVGLDQTAGYWADLILRSRLKERSMQELTGCGYDVKYAHDSLENYYLELYEQIKD